MSLEQELRRALGRKEPPNGLANRVLARIASGEVSTAAPAPASTRQTARIPMAARRWRRASLPIAASLVFAFGATFYLQQQQQRQMREEQLLAEQATRDVVLALQIASETVSAAQAKVEEMTRYEP